MDELVQLPRTYEALYVDGRWAAPLEGRTFTSIDPANAREWATVPRATEADADIAVAGARRALNGEWSTWSATRRGAVLRRLGDLVREHHERLAQLETRDNGKPIRDTRADVARTADWFDFYGGAADKLLGEQIPFSPGSLAYTRREPVGVVVAITPWNSPLSMYSWKLGPALAAGNAVVLKPAEQTPVTALELAALAEQAGLPAGVLNVLPGFGDVGARLVAHADVNKVAFTGSHSTAQRIMAGASANLTRLTLECGGKAPHIVFADADLEAALTVAVYAAFRSTGQSCTLGSRLLLQREIHDDFVEHLVARTRRIRVGLPLDERTHIGPHATDEQLTKTLDYVSAAQAEGATLAIGGGRLGGALADGYFVEPAIFTDVRPESRLAQEEVFGPVLSVMSFDDEDDAVRLANSTRFGLNSGVWTRDGGRAHRMAERIEAGLVSVNTFRPIHWMLPFGGVKLSGFGRENGMEALYEYTQVKTVVVNFSEAAPADPFN